MEAFSVSSRCLDSTPRHFSVSPVPRRIGQRSPTGSQTQRRVPGQVLQRGKVASVSVTQSTHLISEQKRLLGLPVLHATKRTPTEESSLSRLKEELVKRAIRAEKEPNQQDDDHKPEKASQSDNNDLWISRTRSMQTAVQIFVSTLFWIALFFVASIWDGESRVQKRHRDRSRRK